MSRSWRRTRTKSSILEKERLCYVVLRTFDLMTSVDERSDSGKIGRRHVRFTTAQLMTLLPLKTLPLFWTVGSSSTKSDYVSPPTDGCTMTPSHY